ncbi:hypothetical protein H3V53_06195 [Paraburkholderia bengalensis]|uniref:HNH endonuclease n=1 Tax=Paraburkholderia bengalensis TaxID=2747562 RepID=A0ABU8IMX4_9BURK
MRSRQQTVAAQLADFSAWYAQRLDREIDYCDVDRDDEGKYGWCPQCECNVHSVRRDFGIGAYEYWGSREVHRDLRDVCPTCEGDLEDERHDEDEESEA